MLNKPEFDKTSEHKEGAARDAGNKKDWGSEKSYNTKKGIRATYSAETSYKNGKAEFAVKVGLVGAVSGKVYLPRVKVDGKFQGDLTIGVQKKGSIVSVAVDFTGQGEIQIMIPLHPSGLVNLPLIINATASVSGRFNIDLAEVARQHPKLAFMGRY